MRTALFISALALVAACNGDKDRKGKKDDDTGDGGTTPAGMLEISSYSDESDGNGVFEVEVDLSNGATAFQITTTSAESVYLVSVTDPSGNVSLDWLDWYYSDNSLTDAFFAYSNTVAFNWPIRDVDGPLAGGVHTVQYEIWNRQGTTTLANVPVDVTVDVKKDDDFGGATVNVQVVYADGIDSNPDLVAATEGAVARWKEVWGAYGLVLDESYVSSTLDPDLPFAYAGSPEVEQVAQSKADGALQLIVGDRIQGDNFTYGIAGGIPGTVEASPLSFVVLSWIVHAGQDGEFDADEIALMGETAAHEVGHFAGLYHPVESDYNYWDAIDDTVQCTNRNTCEDNLGTNLMFPYSICGGGSCVTTDQVTPGQEGVMHRYLGAL